MFFRLQIELFEPAEYARSDAVRMGTFTDAGRTSAMY